MKKIFIKFAVFIIGLSPITSFAQIGTYDLTNFEKQSLGDITAYRMIKIIDAWNFLEQKPLSLRPVVVGIFDTGADLTHPEFNDVKTAAYPIPMEDEESHGTQVAGIIGANNLSFRGQYLSPQMNGLLSGVRGLDYTLQLRQKSTFASFVTIDDFRYFAALDQLARSPLGIHVINGSFGAPLCLKLPVAQFLLKKCCGRGFDENKNIYTDLVNNYPNITFVFAAGNNGIDAQFHLPGGGINAANVMTVAATNLNDGRAHFPSILGEESNFGASVNISAPGVKVYAPRPNYQYDLYFGGTSASAPMVTGTAAILKSLEPEYQNYKGPDFKMDPATIKEILIKSADAINTGESDKRLGSGCFNETSATTGCRLNAYRAVVWYFPPDASQFATTTNLTSKFRHYQLD